MSKKAFQNKYAELVFKISRPFKKNPHTSSPRCLLSQEIYLFLSTAVLHIKYPAAKQKKTDPQADCDEGVSMVWCRAESMVLFLRWRFVFILFCFLFFLRRLSIYFSSCVGFLPVSRDLVWIWKALLIKGDGWLPNLAAPPTRIIRIENYTSKINKLNILTNTQRWIHLIIPFKHTEKYSIAFNKNDVTNINQQVNHTSRSSSNHSQTTYHHREPRYFRRKS